MGLKEQVQGGVAQAFKALGNLARPATLMIKSGTPTRDIVSGESVYTETAYPLKKVVVARFTSQEQDKNPGLADTEKMIFQVAELPEGVEPGKQDTVTDNKGRSWEIIKKMSEPADAIYIFQVRSAQ